jgi:hypothetical protein
VSRLDPACFLLRDVTSADWRRTTRWLTTDGNAASRRSDRVSARGRISRLRHVPHHHDSSNRSRRRFDITRHRCASDASRTAFDVGKLRAAHANHSKKAGTRASPLSLAPIYCGPCH